MAAHPGLGAAEAPNGDALSGTEESGEDHEGETEDAEGETESAAAAGTLRRVQVVEDIDHCGGRENYERCHGPSALGLVHSHVRVSLSLGRAYWRKIRGGLRDGRRRGGRRRRNLGLPGWCRDRKR